MIEGVRAEPKVRTGRFGAVLVGFLWVVVIASHLLGATALKSSMWGTHFYGFFPPGVMVAALAAVGAVGLWSLVRVRVPSATLSPAREVGWVGGWVGGWKRHILEAVVALAALLLFWSFRICHTLLGDAVVLV